MNITCEDTIFESLTSWIHFFSTLHCFFYNKYINSATYILLYVGICGYCNLKVKVISFPKNIHCSLRPPVCLCRRYNEWFTGSIPASLQNKTECFQFGCFDSQVKCTFENWLYGCRIKVDIIEKYRLRNKLMTREIYKHYSYIYPCIFDRFSHLNKLVAILIARAWSWNAALVLPVF